MRERMKVVDNIRRESDSKCLKIGKDNHPVLAYVMIWKERIDCDRKEESISKAYEIASEARVSVPLTASQRAYTECALE